MCSQFFFRIYRLIFLAVIFVMVSQTNKYLEILKSEKSDGCSEFPCTIEFVDDFGDGAGCIVTANYLSNHCFYKMSECPTPTSDNFKCYHPYIDQCPQIGQCVNPHVISLMQFFGTVIVIGVTISTYLIYIECRSLGLIN